MQVSTKDEKNEATSELRNRELGHDNGIAKGGYLRHSKSEKSERHAKDVDVEKWWIDPVYRSRIM